MQKPLGNLKKGLFFIVSAPSGCGKTTLVRKLTKEFDCVIESVSYTTRKPRINEVNGKDYFFISEEEFEKKIQKEDFLEYAKVFDNFYGTDKKLVEKLLLDKKHVVLVIDVQGAMKLKSKIDAVYIFISPPSIQELRNRMNVRCMDDSIEIEKRLKIAKKELKQIPNYDYNIVNQDLEVSYDILKSILIAEEHKVTNLGNYE
ncbi:MAG: guanylate kinase [Parachlamydiales bacterium]|nr:guanylate kinase [Parachlamydiales bacterium]